LFKFIEDGQTCVNNVLQDLNKNYSSLSAIEQFKVRFFLKEFLNQIHLLHKPINHVLSKLQKSAEVNSQSKQSQHQFSESISTKPKSYFSSNSLQQEVDRLSSIISKLEKANITLNFKEQLRVDKSSDPGNVVFSREIHLQDDNVEDFLDFTKNYILATKLELGCLHTHVKREAQKNHFVIYTVWVSMDHLYKHFLESSYRTHIKSIIDFLIEPEKINKMTVPSSWVLKSPI